MPAAARLTAITIVNEVQRKLGLNTTAAFTTTKHAQMLLQLLNEVIAEVGDFGDWQELYEEVVVTASTCGNQFSITASGKEVHNVLEISFNSQSSPLENRSIQDLRRLTRTSSFGNPRQFSIIGVNASGNPNFRVYPAIGSAYNNKTFNIAIYAKEKRLETGDTATVPVFPGNLLIQGLYAKALLEENGGVATNEYQAAYAEYQRILNESIRRFTSDTDNVVRFTPYGWG